MLFNVRLNKGATGTTEACKVEAMCNDFIADQTRCGQDKGKKTSGPEQGILGSLGRGGRHC